MDISYRNFYQRLTITVFFVTLLTAAHGQEQVHSLYEKADYAVHHDHVYFNNAMGSTITTPRTWTVQKNSDGSFSYKDYDNGYRGKTGYNGIAYDELKKKFLCAEIKVSKTKISVYSEDRYIKSSDFYSASETNDPMKIGSMKVPADPFNDKKGQSQFTEEIKLNGQTYKITVQKNCKHERVQLNRGTDMGGGYGIGVTTNYRGKTTATRDYYPEHLFKHKVTLTYSINDIAKQAGMSATDLIIYLIEHVKENVRLGIYGQSSDGFIYCAYRAFGLERFKAQHEQLMKQRQAEQARQDSIRREEEKARLAAAEKARLEAIEQANKAYMEALGPVKRSSLEQAEAKGIRLIDLGLSVRWADRNIGAKNIEDSGDRYAWGEVMPKTDRDAKYKPLIKPKKDAVLDDLSDPATVQWGKGWHVPTLEQWNELFEKCSMVETYDHKGVIFTGPNGNTIFFPFTDYQYWAHYWANSSGYKGYARKASMPRQAKEMLLKGKTLQSSNKPETGSMNAETLLPIRPVME